MEWNRHTSTQLPVAYEETFELETLASIQSLAFTRAIIEAEPTAISTVNTRASVYGGDTWKVSRRLSLDYGLRWELPFPTSYGGPSRCLAFAGRPYASIRTFR